MWLRGDGVSHHGVGDHPQLGGLVLGEKEPGEVVWDRERYLRHLDRTILDTDLDAAIGGSDQRHAVDPKGSLQPGVVEDFEEIGLSNGHTTSFVPDHLIDRFSG